MADIAPTNAPLYAVVVVNTALRAKSLRLPENLLDDECDDSLTRAFHYHVPDALRAKVCEGQLVWVPFGARQLQGVIIGLDNKSPVPSTRDLDRIVDREPVVSPLQIALARWISQYYLAPLHRVILSMLPPGITQSVETLLSLNPEADTAVLGEEQRRICDLLQREGPLTPQQVGRRSRVPRTAAVVSQLEQQGVLLRQNTVRPPAVRPKLEPVVRLSPEAEGASKRLSPQQRRVLEYLTAQSDPFDWIPIRTLTGEASLSPASIRSLVARGLLEQSERQSWRDPLADQRFVPVTPPRMTAAQDSAWQEIVRDLEAPQGKPFLLQGVTGSGKTEIYLCAVQCALARKQGAIVLVPEIALTPQTIRRFGARFPSTLAVLHSKLTPGERYDQWRRIRAGELRVVIGSRSAIFAPMPALGLVILDEEHEWTYKQEQVPHYHTREVARWLAQHAPCTCVLGSATPDIESAYRAERGEYLPLALPQRIMGYRRILEEEAALVNAPLARYQPEGDGAPAPDDALYTDLPPVDVVDMRGELRSGNTSIFSLALRQAIQQSLDLHQQSILFINRRGSATMVLCRDCGHVLRCPRCELPLTYHSTAEDLVCHHCNLRLPVPRRCPICGSRRIRYFGVGTERVEEVVHTLFPTARTVRWDLDTTGGRHDHERILDQFIQGQADILIGTQMVAKGLDLPRVTLVGVITADTMIHLPDLRASERTFQLLTQVAGRAGRSALGGRVIIQTYVPHHPAIRAASQHDYAGFYEQEIAFRREHWYPPLSRLVLLTYWHRDETEAQREMERLSRMLTSKIARLGIPEVDLIGPAPAFFQRVRGKWRWQLTLRGRDPAALLRDIHLPVGWQVDVDPVSLL